MSASFRGGERLAARLKELKTKLENSHKLRVGFLEGATYPDGTPVAYIAIIQEYGATINAQARAQIVYRKPRRLRKGKKGHYFVKASAKGAVAKEVDVRAHTIVIPARPFFRMMIAANKDTWGPELATLLKRTNYDAEKALKMLGEVMEGQLEASILSFKDPPNAKSTVRRKKFDSPLIDKGNLLRGIGSDVK